MLSADSIEAQSSAFYDGIAHDYDRLLDTPRARGMRACFWQRAEALVPPRSRILDFGAGSGIDAEHFARLGHRITAYDVSAGMLGMLERRCAAEIADGTVVPVLGPSAQASRALAASAPFDAVLCNFAVFSALPRLGETLRLFGALVRPGGVALICVQNPWHLDDMRTRGFWRALLDRPFTSVLRYRRGPSDYHFRHSPRQVERAARPEFVLDDRPTPACCRRHFGPWAQMRLVALRRR
jgi:SAM-dependent methyltransferase